VVTERSGDLRLCLARQIASLCHADRAGSMPNDPYIDAEALGGVDVGHALIDSETAQLIQIDRGPVTAWHARPT
jgi:hypothetical protein